MLDITKIPANILTDMRDCLELPADGSKDYQLADKTPETFFDEWCNYEGLVHYGPQLRELWDTIKPRPKAIFQVTICTRDEGEILTQAVESDLSAEGLKTEVQARLVGIEFDYDEVLITPIKLFKVEEILDILTEES